MKITELLKMCDTLFPNEYTQREKLLWCNELGAIINREHNKQLRISKVEIEGGRYVLPAGVRLTEIDRIIINDMLVKKSDALSAGIVLFEEGDRVYVSGSGANKTLKFLLRPHYEEIRDIQLSGVSFSVDGMTVTMPWRDIRSGDILLLEVGDKTYKLTATKPQTNPDSTISFEAKGDALPQGEFCGDIKRVITDETQCSAPFDAMYYDFIAAKICFCQRDYDSYNHHMALFNSRLEDYDRYMIQNTPMLKDSRVSNWWS